MVKEGDTFSQRRIKEASIYGSDTIWTYSFAGLTKEDPLEEFSETDLFPIN